MACPTIYSLSDSELLTLNKNTLLVPLWLKPLRRFHNRHSNSMRLRKRWSLAVRFRHRYRLRRRLYCCVGSGASRRPPEVTKRRGVRSVAGAWPAHDRPSPRNLRTRPHLLVSLWLPWNPWRFLLCPSRRTNLRTDALLMIFFFNFRCKWVVPTMFACL